MLHQCVCSPHLLSCEEDGVKRMKGQTPLTGGQHTTYPLCGVFCVLNSNHMTKTTTMWHNVSFWQLPSTPRVWPDLPDHKQDETRARLHTHTSTNPVSFFISFHIPPFNQPSLPSPTAATNHPLPHQLLLLATMKQTFTVVTLILSVMLFVRSSAQQVGIICIMRKSAKAAMGPECRLHRHHH